MFTSQRKTLPQSSFFIWSCMERWMWSRGAETCLFSSSQSNLALLQMHVLPGPGRPGPREQVSTLRPGSAPVQCCQAWPCSRLLWTTYPRKPGKHEQIICSMGLYCCAFPLERILHYNSLQVVYFTCSCRSCVFYKSRCYAVRPSAHHEGTQRPQQWGPRLACSLVWS